LPTEKCEHDSRKLIISVRKPVPENASALGGMHAESGKFNRALSAMKTISLKDDMPLVHEALQRLDHELARARQEKTTFLKLVHGYGSTGAGGDIRIAVQKRLLEMAENGQIRRCIFGENWSKSDEAAWKLLQSHPDLKKDPDLGRHNRGITIVLL
jgi:hypothetical protein